jgi:hypothetical protein
MFVMCAVLARPQQHRVFKSAGAEKKGEKPDGPVRLKSEVGEEPMVPERDDEPARCKHDEKQEHLKRIHTEVDDVSGDRGK